VLKRVGKKNGCFFFFIFFFFVGGGVEEGFAKQLVISCFYYAESDLVIAVFTLA